MLIFATSFVNAKISMAVVSDSPVFSPWRRKSRERSVNRRVQILIPRNVVNPDKGSCQSEGVLLTMGRMEVYYKCKSRIFLGENIASSGGVWDPSRGLGFGIESLWR